MLNGKRHQLQVRMYSSLYSTVKNQIESTKAVFNLNLLAYISLVVYKILFLFLKYHAIIDVFI